MANKEVLRMGDPRLLRIAEEVTAFDTAELHALLADMRDTMHVMNGGICFAGNHWITTPSTWSSLRIISSTFVELSNFTPASHALASIFETISKESHT